MAKLKLLNKFVLLCALLQVSACDIFYQNTPDTNTEIICPNGSAILIKFVRARDLKAAVRTSYLNKKRLKTSENYTPVRLNDGRSFVIKNIPPEVIIGCGFRESKVGEVEASYVHHF